MMESKPSRQAEKMAEANPPHCGEAKHVLVVEDQALLAAYLHDLLESAGFVVCGPHATSGSAIAALEKQLPMAAILDVHLGGEQTSLPVAQRLQGHRCPFAFVSGVSERDHPVTARFRSTPCFEKPFDQEALLSWLHGLEQ